MTSKELWENLNKLYGNVDYSHDLKSVENEYHAKITMYLLDNPNEKVEISKSRYNRLRDGWPHTWSPWDTIESVMAKKMERYIKWVE